MQDIVRETVESNPESLAALAQAKEMLAGVKLPWQALGQTANQKFAGADQARQWLQYLIDLLEYQLGPKNQKPLYYTPRMLLRDEARLKGAIQSKEDESGPGHPGVVRELGELANIFLQTGRFTDAEDLVIQALQILDDSPGVGHPLTIGLLTTLSTLKILQGKRVEAKSLLARAIKTLEDEGEQVMAAVAMCSLARLYHVGDPAKAELIYKSSLERLENLKGKNDFDYADVLQQYAAFLAKIGRRDEAQQLSTHAQALLTELPGTEKPTITHKLFAASSCAGAFGEPPIVWGQHFQ